MSMTNWKELIEGAFRDTNETWNDVVSNTMTDEQMSKPFDAGYGGHEGCAFTMWTKERVYFPLVYDGAEWVGSAPRNPNGIATEHQGGE
jgi:hypothetical protein